jgi:hypothetical protein
MADQSKSWMRLRWARETHGKFGTAEAFARAVDETGHNYRAHERDPDGTSKAIALDYDKAVAWADVLDVRWQWLLNGEGLPWREDTDPSDRVREALKGLMEPDEIEQIAGLTKLLRRNRAATGTDG